MTDTRMTIQEMIQEWRKGCTHAGPAGCPPTENPAECVECTTGLIKAIENRVQAVSIPSLRSRQAVWEAFMNHTKVEGTDGREFVVMSVQRYPGAEDSFVVHGVCLGDPPTRVSTQMTEAELRSDGLRWDQETAEDPLLRGFLDAVWP